MCPDFGTPKNNQIIHLEQMKILLFLGVPIHKHFRVSILTVSIFIQYHQSKCQYTDAFILTQHYFHIKQLMTALFNYCPCLIYFTLNLMAYFSHNKLFASKPQKTKDISCT